MGAEIDQDSDVSDSGHDHRDDASGDCDWLAFIPEAEDSVYIIPTYVFFRRAFQSLSAKWLFFLPNANPAPVAAVRSLGGRGVSWCSPTEVPVVPLTGSFAKASGTDRDLGLER